MRKLRHKWLTCPKHIAFDKNFNTGWNIKSIKTTNNCQKVNVLIFVFTLHGIFPLCTRIGGVLTCAYFLLFPYAASLPKILLLSHNLKNIPIFWSFSLSLIDSLKPHLPSSHDLFANLHDMCNPSAMFWFNAICSLHIMHHTCLYPNRKCGVCVRANCTRLCSVEVNTKVTFEMLVIYWGSKTVPKLSCGSFLDCGLHV